MQGVWSGSYCNTHRLDTCDTDVSVGLDVLQQSFTLLYSTQNTVLSESCIMYTFFYEGILERRISITWKTSKDKGICWYNRLFYQKSLTVGSYLKEKCISLDPNSTKKNQYSIRIVKNRGKNCNKCNWWFSLWQIARCRTIFNWGYRQSNKGGYGSYAAVLCDDHLRPCTVKNPQPVH